MDFQNGEGGNCRSVLEKEVGVGGEDVCVCVGGVAC